MSPQLNYVNKKKEYDCFICGKKSAVKDLPLIQTQTVFSRITLGEKLQEVLGSKYVVLISSKDSICWDCGAILNWIDRYEYKVDLMKEHILDHVHEKYRKIEICLQEEKAITEGPLPGVPPAPLPVSAPLKRVHFQTTKDTFGSLKRQKEFSCKLCGKEYATLVSLTMHIQRFHGTKEICSDCKATFDSKMKLKQHMKLAHGPAGKDLSCVSCGFHTNNTEIYCRHICNSRLVSLTCITCQKRYVDSNFREDTGNFQCRSCQDSNDKANSSKGMNPVDCSAPGTRSNVNDLKPSTTGAKQNAKLKLTPQNAKDVGQEEDYELRVPSDSDIGSSELATEMPEFFKEPEREVRKSVVHQNESNAYVRCEACGEQFKLSELTNHPCLIQSENLELFEIEPPVENISKLEKTNTLLLTCKSCHFQFSSIELLRTHWDHTGHLREIDAPQVETKEISDKFKKTETTFKVVKQNFNIRAIIPGQNEEILRADEDFKDIFVRVSDLKTDPIEDFVKRSSNSCGTCGCNFPSAELLFLHQKNDCLTCVTCGIDFYDNTLLKKHYLFTGHASKLRVSKSIIRDGSYDSAIFKCHLCSKIFSSRFLLRKHFLVHYKGTEKGACQFCLLEFDNKNDIQQHVLEVHGAHLYKCSYCERTFMSEVFRNRHEAKHKLAKPQTYCNICNIKVGNQKSLLLHNETYHCGKSCRLCGKIIDDPIALRRHERRHYFDKELECNLCKKRFRNKKQLLFHSKQHSIEEMKYQCDICNLGFVSDECYKEHRMTHSSRGKYKCIRCSLTFTSRAHYWTHTKTHDVSYPCSVCNRTFKTSSLLAIHRRKHWRVRPYQCPQCHRVFSVSSTLLRHLYVHSRQYPHRCAICKKGFLTRHAYHRHAETIHAVSNSFGSSHRRPHIPSLPFNPTDEDIFQAADTLISDDSIMFNDFSNNKDTEQSSSTGLITNEVVVETTELFDEILHS